MDSIYLWERRFISKQEIEEGIDRIVNPEKYRRKERNKLILQSLAGSLIGGAIAIPICLGLANLIDNHWQTPVKSEKTTNVKQQPTNPVTTAAYNKEIQKTL